MLQDGIIKVKGKRENKNMKTLSKTSRSKKKIIISAAVILAVVIGGVLAYAKLATPPAKQDSSTTQNGSETPKTNNEPATPQQQDAGSNQKQDIVDRDQNQSTTPKSLAVTITAANQNGSMVNIRSLINTVSANGTCALVITNGSSKTTKTSGMQALAESSTCQGFDIPVGSLPKGTWHIMLSVAAGDAKGSAKKDIVVN